MTLSSHAAATRFAWREAWRARGRSTLIALMIAFPVGLAVFGSIVLHSSAPDFVGWEMGTADVVLEVPHADAPDVASMLPAESRVVRFFEQEARVDSPGALLTPTVTDAPVGDPLLSGRLEVREGRGPIDPTEIAISPSISRELGIGVGQTIRLTSPAGVYRVTGIVAPNNSLSSWMLLVAPGSLPTTGSSTWLVSVPRDAGGVTSEISKAYPRMYTSIRQPPGKASGTGGLIVLAALALFEVALVSAAALSVVTQRQLRTMGILGAVGANWRHRCQIVLLSGILLGVGGSVLGAVGGIAVAALLRPVLETFLNRAIPSLVFSASDIVITVTLGLVSSLAAAVVPAWTVGRTSTVEALAGRRAVRAKPSRAGLGGVAAAAAGASIVAIGSLGPTSLPVIVVGALVGISGFAAASPSLIVLAGGLAGGAPLAMRLALRDAARNRGRTAPAVAAIMACLALAVSISTFTACDDVRGLARQTSGGRVSMTGAVAAGRAFTEQPLGDSLMPLATGALAASTAVALGILSVALALVANETRSTLETMSSVGLSPTARRAFAAMQAFVIIGLGAVLAIPAGLLPALAIVVSRGTYPIAIPWAALALVGLGLPVVAALFAGLFAERPHLA